MHLSRDVGAILGQGDNRNKRASNSIGTSLGHLFGTFLFHPLAGAKFLIIIPHSQIVLSFNHILLIYIAYLISVVAYKCSKRIPLHFKKGTFAPPSERQEGSLLLSAPLPGVPVFVHLNMENVIDRK